MITLTQFNGNHFDLNADLIEKVEAIPDTTITMVDGDRYVVRETRQVVLDRIEQFRARVIARARLIHTAAAEEGHPTR